MFGAGRSPRRPLDASPSWRGASISSTSFRFLVEGDVADDARGRGPVRPLELDRHQRGARPAVGRSARRRRARGRHRARSTCATPRSRASRARSRAWGSTHDASSRDRLREIVLAAAREASDLVMRVYAAPFEVAYKSKDDPVTRADHESNALLCERLSRAFPGLPIVAEESDPVTYAGSRPRRPLVRRPARRHAGVRGEERGVRRHDRAGGAGASDPRRHHGAGLGPRLRGRRGRRRLGGRGRRDAHAHPRVDARTRSRAPPWSCRARARRRSSRSSRPRSGGRPPVVLGSSGLKAAVVATGDHDVYLQPGRAGMRWDACSSDALVARGGRSADRDRRRDDRLRGARAREHPRPPGHERPAPRARHRGARAPVRLDARVRDRADVVIVGAGIMGLSIAYHLAARGVTRVAVVDQGYLCGGASGRNGGGVRAQWSSEQNVRLMLESIRMCREFAREDEDQRVAAPGRLPLSRAHVGPARDAREERRAPERVRAAHADALAERGPGPRP